MAMHQYRHASLASTNSKAVVRVGAALVGSNGFVLLTSYNGVVAGAIDYVYRYQKPLKSIYIAHAEQNLISMAAKMGIATQDCDLFITHLPCTRCMNLLISAGIKNVFYGPNDYGKINLYRESVEKLCEETGVGLYALRRKDGYF